MISILVKTFSKMFMKSNNKILKIAKIFKVLTPLLFQKALKLSISNN